MAGFGSPHSLRAQEAISDEAGLFSPAAVTEANQILRNFSVQIKDMVILVQTCRHPQNSGATEQLSSGANRLLDRLAAERLAEAKKFGVLILFCGEPKGLGIAVSETIRGRGLNNDEIEDLVKELQRSVGQGEWDDGLLLAVQRTATPLSQRLRRFGVRAVGFRMPSFSAEEQKYLPQPRATTTPILPSRVSEQSYLLLIAAVLVIWLVVGLVRAVMFSGNTQSGLPTDAVELDGLPPPPRSGPFAIRLMEGMFGTYLVNLAQESLARQMPLGGARGAVEQESAISSTQDDGVVSIPQTKRLRTVASESGGGFGADF